MLSKASPSGVLESYHSRLNPCSNGICSRRWRIFSVATTRSVLILVLMEYALEAKELKHSIVIVEQCLNPCSNGICSRSFDWHVEPFHGEPS